MHIHAVLHQLREHILFVKPSKCEWMQRSIDILGRCHVCP